MFGAIANLRGRTLTPTHQAPTEKEPTAIVVDWLKAATPALTELAEELKPDLHANRWTHIIGDDTSGRLPSIFTKRLADNASEQFRKQDRTRLLFVAGGYEPFTMKTHDDLRDVTSRVQALPLVPGNRVLVVTEVCRKGVGIAPLIQALSNEGIDSDLAVVCSEYTREEITSTLKEYGCKLPDDFTCYIGGDEANYLGAIGERTAGVYKQRGEPIAQVNTENEPYDKAYARKYMTSLADKLCPALVTAAELS